MYEKKLHEEKEKKSKKANKIKLKISGSDWKLNPIALGLVWQPNLTPIRSDVDLAAKPDLSFLAQKTKTKKTIPLAIFF